MVKAGRITNGKKTYEKPCLSADINFNTLFDGRPLKFDSPKQMRNIIIPYFEDCRDKEISPTVSGLAVRLGVGRNTLIDYSKKSAYSNTIKKAKQYIESCSEDALLNKRTSPIGNIFSLKNNFGWRDDRTVVVEHKNIASIMKKELDSNEVIDGELVDEQENNSDFLLD